MTSTTSPWRAAADPDDLREYDRFGPWIDKVTEHVDMPRRFRPWWPELSAARYLLKVPRPYDRAQISPGMDLYGSVIAVFPDKVSVLRAGTSDIVRRDVPRAEVVATVLHSNLLVGRWTLLLADGDKVEVQFNGVSHGTVAEVDRYVLSAAPSAPSSVPSLPNPRPRDHYFQSVAGTLNEGAAEPARHVHIEEPGQPCRNERDRRRRSAGMMVLTTPHDLLLFNRGMAAQPLLRSANYSSNLVRIPFRFMTSYGIRSPEVSTPPRFSELVITCDRQVITQAVLARPDGVADLLAGHGVTAIA